MTVDAGQVQTLIILEVGETDAGALAANIATIWDSYADKAAISPRLQEAYTRLRCCRIALGEVRQQVTVSLPGSQSLALGQKAQALAGMLKDAQTEIALWERKARAARPIQVGRITQMEPVSLQDELQTPVAWSPDPNDSRYAGDPLYPPTLTPGA